MKKRNFKCSRRGFIQKTATGAAGLMALPLAKKVSGESTTPQEKSRVVVVKHDDSLQSGKFNQDVIRVMMNAGITRLTDITDVGKAWKSIFPDITTSSVIAIKINCLFQVSTHKEVTNSVIDGLKRMVVDGSPFPENNIIVWDKSDGDLQARGYKINKSKTGVRYFGTPGYSSTAYPIDEGDNQKLSNIITDTCNYLINLGVLKNHGTGVTLSMKNHYGSIHNLGGSHMHNYPLAKVLPSISALAPIRQKQVICICDAIQCVASGGPDGPPTGSPKSIILSKDLVAHDYTGAKMLEAFGCKTASITGTAKHVYNASQLPYSLGTCDPAQIDRIEINNPIEISGFDSRNENNTVPERFVLRQTYPNPFNGRTFILYELPENTAVKIRVLDAGGRIVRVVFEGNQGPGWFQKEWDGKGDDGSQAPSGIYLCVLQAGRIRRTVKMQLIQ
jgi:uncharacterized protein (DUF362 family)